MATVGSTKDESADSSPNSVGSKSKQIEIRFVEEALRPPLATLETDLDGEASLLRQRPPRKIVFDDNGRLFEGHLTVESRGLKNIMEFLVGRLEEQQKMLVKLQAEVVSLRSSPRAYSAHAATSRAPAKTSGSASPKRKSFEAFCTLWGGSPDEVLRLTDRYGDPVITPDAYTSYLLELAPFKAIRRDVQRMMSSTASSPSRAAPLLLPPRSAKKESKAEGKPQEESHVAPRRVEEAPRDVMEALSRLERDLVARMDRMTVAKDREARQSVADLGDYVVRVVKELENKGVVETQKAMPAIIPPSQSPTFATGERRKGKKGTGGGDQQTPPTGRVGGLHADEMAQDLADRRSHDGAPSSAGGGGGRVTDPIARADAATAIQSVTELRGYVEKNFDELHGNVERLAQATGEQLPKGQITPLSRPTLRAGREGLAIREAERTPKGESRAASRATKGGTSPRASKRGSGAPPSPRSAKSGGGKRKGDAPKGSRAEKESQDEDLYLPPAAALESKDRRGKSGKPDSREEAKSRGSRDPHDRQTGEASRGGSRGGREFYGEEEGYRRAPPEGDYRDGHRQSSRHEAGGSAGPRAQSSREYRDREARGGSRGGSRGDREFYGEEEGYRRPPPEGDYRDGHRQSSRHDYDDFDRGELQVRHSNEEYRRRDSGSKSGGRTKAGGSEGEAVPHAVQDSSSSYSAGSPLSLSGNGSPLPPSSKGRGGRGASRAVARSTSSAVGNPKAVDAIQERQASFEEEVGKRLMAMEDRLRTLGRSIMAPAGTHGGPSIDRKAREDASLCMVRVQQLDREIMFIKRKVLGISPNPERSTSQDLTHGGQAGPGASFYSTAERSFGMEAPSEGGGSLSQGALGKRAEKPESRGGRGHAKPIGSAAPVSPVPPSSRYSERKREFTNLTPDPAAAADAEKDLAIRMEDVGRALSLLKEYAASAQQPRTAGGALPSSHESNPAMLQESMMLLMRALDGQSAPSASAYTPSDFEALTRSLEAAISIVTGLPSKECAGDLETNASNVVRMLAAAPAPLPVEMAAPLIEAAPSTSHAPIAPPRIMFPEAPPNAPGSMPPVLRTPNAPSRSAPATSKASQNRVPSSHTENREEVEKPRAEVRPASAAVGGPGSRRGRLEPPETEEIFVEGLLYQASARIGSAHRGAVEAAPIDGITSSELRPPTSRTFGVHLICRTTVPQENPTEGQEIIPLAKSSKPASTTVQPSAATESPTVLTPGQLGASCQEDEAMLRTSGGDATLLTGNNTGSFFQSPIILPINQAFEKKNSLAGPHGQAGGGRQAHNRQLHDELRKKNACVVRNCAWCEDS